MQNPQKEKQCTHWIQLYDTENQRRQIHKSDEGAQNAKNFCGSTLPGLRPQRREKSRGLRQRCLACCPDDRKQNRVN